MQLRAAAAAASLLRVRPAALRAGAFSARALSASAKPSGEAEKGTIAGIEGLAGPARAEAMFKQAYGEELYDRDATSYQEEGTRENPIPILSIEDNRIVGVTLPDDATIRWFTLKANELVYDPNTCTWFALKQVSKSEVDEWVSRAEKQVLGGGGASH